MSLKVLNYIRIESVVVFLLAWLITGAFINVQDQKAFNLQQMGVDAIVSYGTLTLGHSDLEILKPQGDTFRTDKGILPAKQPGQFVFGAIPYSLLKMIGVSYEDNYNITASLVTWLSTSLISALSLAFLFRVLMLWGYSRKESAWSVITIGVASHWIVYAGIAHHDIIAASWLLIALCYSEVNMIKHAGDRISYSVLTGFFAALTIFTSMLPALIVMAFGFYVLYSKHSKNIFYTGVGFILGLLPLFIYNSLYFGGPLTQANVAGNYADTFFSFKYEQFVHHLNAYLGFGGLSIWKYAPSVVLGFFCVFFLPKALSRIKVLVYLSFFLHLSYLLNIETLGTCQYGPRYLLPLVPLCAIGLAELVRRINKEQGFIFGIILGAVFIHSIASGVVGAAGGAMQCDLNNFMMWRYLVEHGKLTIENLPLFYWCLIPLVMIIMVIAYYRWVHNTRQDSEIEKTKTSSLETFGFDRPISVPSYSDLVNQYMDEKNLEIITKKDKTA